MTTHDRQTDDIPTITEADPRATNDAQTSQEQWSTASTDPSAAPTTMSGPGSAGQALEPEAARHAGVTDGESRPTRTAEANPPLTQAEPSGPGIDGSRRELQTPSQTALFADNELSDLRARWGEVQAGFVDDPRGCVHKADALVSDVVNQISTSFTDARSRLEQQWDRGEQATTEDLRVTLKRYRDFFDRLLAV